MVFGGQIRVVDPDTQADSGYQNLGAEASLDIQVILT
jgi:hypothetical protein